MFAFFFIETLFAETVVLFIQHLFEFVKGFFKKISELFPNPFVQGNIRQPPHKHSKRRRKTMKRKLLSLFLASLMLFGVAAPALAAEEADQELMNVTAKVKATLELDTELYDDFQGYSEEDVLLGKRWKLSWSGDGIGLTITADDSGKIYSYNAYRAVEDIAVALPSRSNGGRLDIPRLPEDKSGAAYDTAKAFLAMVLEAPVETIELSNKYRPSLSQNTYWYNGTVLLNGLESPITCHVSVRASDLTVLRFDRSDENSGYLGGVPGKDTSVTDAQARRLLRSTIDMEAKYVLLDDGKTARVQYVPLSGDSYYVDGATGELINLTELRAKLWASGGAGNRYFTSADMEAAAPEDAGAMKNALTQAEKDGAAILKTALSKEDLDKVLKNAWPEIGLEKYTLATATYSISEKKLDEGVERTPEDYDVTCRLTYGRQLDGATANKYVTVDAKTGELQSLRSGRSYKDGWPDSFPISTPVNTAQSTAEAFLTAFAGENYAKLGLFSTDSAKDTKGWQHTFTFQQENAGYFFDGNSYTVGVDAADGTLTYISGHFDNEITLVTPAKVVSKAAAIETYETALALHYGYMEVPVSISLAGQQIMPLLKEAGYEYVESLKTGFVLSQPENKHIRGVDAETGEVISWDYTPGEETGITYDDLDGHWVKPAADALAVFQIGFGGGSLKPAEALTQRDMIALLLSVEGYSFDPATATKDDVDWLYSRAYTYGLVTPETRNEEKTVTRGELVKCLLDSAGYEKIANIPGIFRCDFADAASIPAGDMGYAALAQGLGLVNGGSAGSYAAGRTATRAEAISFLYQYMK